MGGAWGRVVRTSGVTQPLSLKLSELSWQGALIGGNEDGSLPLHSYPSDLPPNRCVNVVSLLDYSLEQGVLVFAYMQISLFQLKEQVIKKGKEIPVDMICQFATDMLTGLAWLHEMNVVHRDMKLENAMLNTTSTRPEVVLIDFGLADDACVVNEVLTA